MLVNYDDTRPAIVVIAAAEPAIWTVNLGAGTQVEELIVMGHKEHQVAVNGPSPRVIHAAQSNELVGSRCAYRMPYKGGGCNTSDFIGAVESLAGRRVASFDGCYDTSGFDVPVETAR
jgi:hypothetical protein